MRRIWWTGIHQTLRETQILHANPACPGTAGTGEVSEDTGADAPGQLPAGAPPAARFRAASRVGRVTRGTRVLS
jgi:hypothetical protein